MRLAPSSSTLASSRCRSAARLAAASLAAVLLLGFSGLHAQAPKQVLVPIMGSKGEDMGMVPLSPVKGGVRFRFDLKNLPEGMHGVHIHQHSVCDAPQFAGAGGHYNPDQKKHGFKNPMGHHNGDFPTSLQVGSNGKARAEFVLTTVSLDPAAPNSLLADGGTALVIHAGPDDEMTDPSGASGGRIACGVIKTP